MKRGGVGRATIHLQKRQGWKLKVNYLCYLLYVIVCITYCKNWGSSKLIDVTVRRRRNAANQISHRIITARKKQLKLSFRIQNNFKKSIKCMQLNICYDYRSWRLMFFSHFISSHDLLSSFFIENPDIFQLIGKKRSVYFISKMIFFIVLKTKLVKWFIHLPQKSHYRWWRIKVKFTYSICNTQIHRHNIHYYTANANPTEKKERIDR